jgi:hypothetical protein
MRERSGHRAGLEELLPQPRLIQIQMREEENKPWMRYG